MLMPVLLANAAGFYFSIGVGIVAIMSMIGDVVDENEMLTGKREEGLYYSARAFFAKAAYSFGHFFAGVVIGFVRAPAFRSGAWPARRRHADSSGDCCRPSYGHLGHHFASGL